MAIRGLVIAALLLGPSIAAGQSAAGESRRQTIDPAGYAPDYGFVGVPRADGLVLARQVIPASDVVPQIDGTRNVAVAQSRLVYLNKSGVMLSPGANDARANKSTVVTAQTAIAGWNPQPAMWSETVTCMRDLFKAYDITFVDVDPGNVPHIEAVFGGVPSQVGMDASVAGVSPFTTDCSIIENSIVFTFTNAFQFTSREACEIMAQEVAHSYGLDHELLPSDPMTYLEYTGNRSFQDIAAQCGELAGQPRACGINGSVCRQTQNSVQMLRDRLGPADAVLPVLSISTPPDNWTVPPGFVVKAKGTDNKQIVSATLKIDGAVIDTKMGAGPFMFGTPISLTEGGHSVVVTISDGKNQTSTTRSVTVKVGAPPAPELDEDDPLGNDVVGGCAASRGGASALPLFALFAFTARRRRRR